MPLVRMLTSMAGTGTVPTRDYGEEIEMGAEEARTLIDAGIAELVRGPVVNVPERRVRQPETPEGARRTIRRR